MTFGRYAVPIIKAASLAFAVTAVASIVPAHASGPVLHEFIPPDDDEDLALAVTTPGGELSAAIETSSGVVRAPDTERLPSPTESAYREPHQPAAPPVYRPDRDTRRPKLVSYDDPFSPSIAPYKRLRAFDMVGPDYALRVREPSLTRIPVGGEARVGEDEFYADLAVDFEAAATVLIPSVGPGARILRLHATPRLMVEVWRDGAENWHAKAPSSPRGRAQLVMQVAIARTAFGGDFAMPSWAGLPKVAPLPPGAARSFAKVEAAMGLTRGGALSPTETVHRMVSYFRSFVPSEDPPHGHGDIYLDLALSKKGVCRHRAFAFLVTSLGLGIPARMVINEAHAWVEVAGDRGWQRIDLGGAAGEIDGGASEQRPNYRPPADGFEWPASAESGSGHRAAERGRQSGSNSSMPPGQPGTGGQDGADPSRPPSPARTDGSRTSASDARSRGESPVDRERGPEGVSASSPDERPRSRVALAGASDVTVHHGSPLRVAGRVDVEGTGCGDLRVDVLLKRHDSAMKTNVGALTTSATGAFDGSIFLPLTFPVGEYEIIVSTPGDARCGAGTSGQ